jgi:hypothetical protein
VVRGQRHAPVALYPWERPGIHRTEGWVDPRAGMDRCGKSRPPPGFDPRTVQPVGSRYTVYATRPKCSAIVSCKLESILRIRAALNWFQKLIFVTFVSKYANLFVFFSFAIVSATSLQVPMNNITVALSQSRTLFT